MNFVLLVPTHSSVLFSNKVKMLKVAYVVSNKNNIVNVADIIDPDSIYFHAAFRVPLEI